MREPASPNGDKTAENVASPDSSAVPIVSIPDRRRIDSDVRAFLREPSTPWIVFDQEGRPPSQLAVGEMLPMRAAILSDAGFFPSIAAIDAAAAAQSQSRIEPSSLAVASDLVDDAPAPVQPDESFAIPTHRLSRRVIGAAAAVLAMVSTLGIGTWAVRSFSTNELAAKAPTNALSAQGARAQGGASAADAPPASFDVSAAAAALTATATPVAPAVPVPAPADESAAKAAAKKYGRLTVAGDARSRDVFMDGKRMLGRGARSFTIMCGTHTIAVGTRTDTREVEIPCTGTAELVITK